MMNNALRILTVYPIILKGLNHNSKEITQLIELKNHLNRQKDLNHSFYRERMGYLMAKPSQLPIEIKQQNPNNLKVNFI
tara:strand:- start:105 stop:341 length:237 start_codon:yes stop_codon:yes gene_type:complete